MTRVFARPLFRAKAIQKFAQGGIVAPAVAAEPDPQQVLGQMGQQIEMTDTNLDNAQNIDEILTAFSGQPRTAQDARAELAELVGETDAEKTPESVLALVQPTFEMMKLAQSMAPPAGGIAEAPVKGYATGGYVTRTPREIWEEAQQIEAQIPQRPANRMDAILAMAQFGRGMAEGPTFAKGMQKATEYASPYAKEAMDSAQKQRAADVGYVRDVLKDERKYGVEAELAQQKFANDQRMKAFDAKIDLEIAAAKQAGEYSLAIELEGMKLKNAKELASAKTEEERIQLGIKHELTLKELEKKHGYDVELEEAKSANDISPAMKEARDLYPGDDPAMVALRKKHVQYKTFSAAEQQASQFFEPGTPEYKAKLDEIIEKSAINMGNKKEFLDYELYRKREDKRIEEFQKDAGHAAENQVHTQRIRAALNAKGPNGKPAFTTGFGADTRQTIGRAMQLVGMDPTDLPLIGSPEVADNFESASNAMTINLGEKLTRSTNLQVGLIKDSVSGLIRTPEGNLVLVDVYDGLYKRDRQINEYARQLMDAQGIHALNPQELDIPMPKFDPKMAPMDENGRPTMSINDYITWLDHNDPIVNKDLQKRMEQAQSAPGAGSWREAAKEWLGTEQGATTTPTGGASIDFSKIQKIEELRAIAEAHRKKRIKLTPEQIKQMMDQERILKGNSLVGD